MYAAIYSGTKETIYRQHLGNITSPKFEISRRTFDFGGGPVSGHCDFDMGQALVYVICDDYGRKRYAGFVKSVKPGDDGIISFTADDFKRVLDTDIILDFSNDETPDLTVKGIFTKVMGSVLTNKDPAIATLSIAVVIPDDATDTSAIADYRGQYLVVNALAFLKTYLSYYGYFIQDDYDVALDQLTIEFKKSSPTPVAIRLKDFIHEKTSNDIKTNKTIATLTYKTINENQASWVESTLAYYNSQSAANRASILGTVLPDTEGYKAGFALKVSETLEWVVSDVNEYYNSPTRTTRIVQQYGVNICYQYVGFSMAKSIAGPATSYTEGTVVVVYYQVNGTGETCTSYPTYIRAAAVNTAYYQLSNVTYTARPNLPEKVYTLGKDNQIYEGYAPEAQRIYPIVAKVFEATHLSEAQLNAVYELVNNRYVENILIRVEDLQTPYDLGALSLFTMVRVYDSGGSYKDIPVSEKNIVYNERDNYTTVKLGFKKTQLTEIIKNDIGAPNVVKSAVTGGGGSTTVVEFEIWEGPTAPDPSQYNTWFRPAETEE